MKKIMPNLAIPVFLFFCSNLLAITINFDEGANPSDILHSSEDIDFLGRWHFSGPYGADESNNIWSGAETPAFIFTSNFTLNSLEVYVTAPCTLQITDFSNPDYFAELLPGEMYFIETFWEQASELVQFTGCGSSLGISAISYSEPGPVQTDFEPPIASIVFPTPTSLIDRETITVRGTAFDFESSVASVTVNGVAANSTDGFENWIATVPLLPGMNELIVAVTDAASNTDAMAATATVTRDDVLVAFPYATVLDSNNNRIILSDNRTRNIITADLTTSERSILSGPDTGTGPLITSPVSIALDTVGNRLFAVGLQNLSGGASVFEIDLANGNRSLISGQSLGAGPNLMPPGEITFDPVNNRLLAATGLNSVMAIDLTTGDRSIFSRGGSSTEPDIGSGPAILGITSLAVDPGNNRVLVTDFMGGALLAIDLTTGNRTLLSGSSIGTGPFISVNTDSLALDPANNRAFVYSLSPPEALIEINLVTGNRRVVSSNTTGTGPEFVRLQTIEIDTANNRMLAADSNLSALFSIDLATGNRTILWQNIQGNGPRDAFGLSSLYDADSDRVLHLGLLASNANGIINSVDIYTGQWSRFTDDTGNGGAPFFLPSYMTLGNEEALIINFNSLLGVDLFSGMSYVISDPGLNIGSGPTFDTARSVTYDDASNTAYILDGFYFSNVSTIFAVDLTTGNRQILSDNSTGSGISFSATTHIAMDTNANRVLVADAGLDAIISVDPATGNRAIVADNSTGSGAPLNFPGAMAFDADNNRLLVANMGENSLISIDLATGERSLIAEGLYVTYSISIDNNRGHAWVGSEHSRLYLVDLLTGERTIVTK